MERNMIYMPERVSSEQINPAHVIFLRKQPGCSSEQKRNATYKSASETWHFVLLIFVRRSVPRLCFSRLI
jgi:hypothetical protein